MYSYELKNIYLGYDDVILSDISLKIKAGKMTAITGISGSGKSTLLYYLGNILEKKSGVGYLFGKKLATPGTKESRELLKKDLSFMFQNYGLIDSETVVENLNIISKDNEKIKSTLTLMGLEKYEDRKITRLSGGEQQRVAFCKIILKNPKIILADEPTGSLDEENSLLIMNHLRKFANEGKTVIIVTHDEKIADLCDERFKL